MYVRMYIGIRSYACQGRIQTYIVTSFVPMPNKAMSFEGLWLARKIPNKFL